MAKKLYQYKVPIGRDLDGKIIRKSIYAHTKRELKKKAEEIRAQGYQPIDKDITLAQWANKWLETYKKGNVSDSTYEKMYKANIDGQIKPYFKDAKLSSLKAIDIKEFYNSKLHYSQSLLDKLRVIMVAMYRDAIENELVKKNPALGVKATSKQIQKEKRAYSKEETNKIIEFAKMHDDGLGIVLMLSTGLRIGELMGLRWEDIDLKNKILSVNRAVSEANGVLSIGKPKTPASMADIPLSNSLCDYLKITPINIKGYVIPNSKNSYYDPKNYRNRIFKPFIETASEQLGIDIYSPHELRHTYGSLVYESTDDIYITSKLMRHASIDITAKTYVHESMDKKRNAVEKTFQKVGQI